MKSPYLEVFNMAKDMHVLLSDIMKGMESEDGSGNLTPEYLTLTTAILGCKTVIVQMEKMDANH